ncbi:MAG: hypothetical protein JWN03_5192 [Nocardia sp.]|uniref:class I adenylate-forming enzyme family protein n=1 Tax=Nocardia sp. TaxID=1821 RepID=UPI002609FE1B|nr:class I adenylate-forming enzyme family protein [Nocardia sp.]MCU1644917.1 hypothetical protein [Nocardia sp.]
MSDFFAPDRVGAGNLLAVAATHPQISATCRIELDHGYHGPDGREYHRFTLPELDTLATGIAAGFHRAGVRAKDPVGIFVSEGARYLVNFAALTKLGAIPVFINSYLDPAVATKIFEKVGVTHFVTDVDHDVDSVGAVKHLSEPYDGAGDDFTPYEHALNDPVLIAHTSGTTGVPKAVQFNHGGFYYGVYRQRTAELGKRILSALPQSHGSAISVVMSAVVRGATIRLVTDRTPRTLAAGIAEFRPALVAAFPRAFVDLCRLDLDRYDLSSVARWMSTGDANHETHIRELIRHGTYTGRDGMTASGSLFIDNFGSSEFGFAMFRNVHAPGTDRYGRCIGKPFEWVDVRVLGDNDKPAPPLTVGRLALKSPTMTAGYWNDTSRSEKNRLSGYWLTGDLAFQDDRGLCYHVDRTTDKIVYSDGETYSALAEELVMAEIDEIFDCSLVSTYDQATDGRGTTRGEIILTVDVRHDGVDSEVLRSRVNVVLRDAGMPTVDKLMVQSSGGYLGVTGKALKRDMRDDFRSSKAAR